MHNAFRKYRILPPSHRVCFVVWFYIFLYKTAAECVIRFLADTRRLASVRVTQPTYRFIWDEHSMALFITRGVYTYTAQMYCTIAMEQQQVLEDLLNWSYTHSGKMRNVKWKGRYRRAGQHTWLTVMQFLCLNLYASFYFVWRRI